MPYHHYEVIGRRKPKKITVDIEAQLKGEWKQPEEEEPKIYRMKIFAPNTVVAKSRFWYFLSKLKKIKRANGEIITINEIFEKQPNHVKNYGIWLRYDSRSGTHNMYKEFRDTTLVGAVQKMYAEMASRHRCRKSSIQIIKTCIVADADTTARLQPFIAKNKPEFNLLHRVPRRSSKSHTKVYSAHRPVTFF
eukprot:CAMPEP_0114506678 /NCGR_PEP_ID=MMETSP0109-20121206/11555_1 /TAXON_ID=29199 /ORGANISM="Chlorarachnion reptans, Strain CCCM449" /LENGTH=191 /DNA_ID=CAMNT_0001685281 /DNA_START=97 /DNA_END=672 /DNA_ORIENTATION=-